MSLSTNPARVEPLHIFDTIAEALRQYGEYVEFGFAVIQGVAGGRFEVVFTKSFIDAQVNHLISRGVARGEAEYVVESYGNETA